MTSRPTNPIAETPREEDDAGAAEWVAARLSQQQLKALDGFVDARRLYTPSDLGVSPATLYSMWGFLRGQRGILPPLMLVASEIGQDRRRYWDITKFGKRVREAASLARKGVGV